MTLRARLTGAFLVVVLGPVVIGSIFVGLTVNSVNQSRERDRLDLAATNSLRTAIAATCDRLAATAEAAATATVAGTIRRNARRSSPPAEPARSTSRTPPACRSSPPTAHPRRPGRCARRCRPPPGPCLRPERRRALHCASRRPCRCVTTAGATIGYSYAVQTLRRVIRRPASTAATGAQITVCSAVRPSPAARAPRRPVISPTTPPGSPPVTSATTAAGSCAGSIATADQPFTIAISVPVITVGRDLSAIVLAVVAFARSPPSPPRGCSPGTTTSRSTKSPHAADRVAEGDLETRVPVRHDDEVGHLGAAFNRMSREMQTYAPR